MGINRSVFRWAVVGLGVLVAVGGSACGSTGSWEPEDSLATRGQSLLATTGSMATRRAGHTATLLQDGSVLVTGGWTRSGSLSAMTSSAERYVPATGTWSATGPMLATRERHGAVRLQDGRVLVAAGLGSMNPMDPYGTTLASAEVYDPATGTWSATGGLATGRTYPTLSLLQDGRALIVGGSGAGPLTSAEVYDPATGTWSTTGSLSTGRTSHTATVLPSGKVLVVGGNVSGGTLASAELYDPTSGTWSPAGSLAYARSQHSAHLLPNGRVLIVGGFSSGSYPLMAELFDPSTGTWSNASQLNVIHSNFAGVSLADGSVLAAGGTTGTDQPRIERYNLATGAWALMDNHLTPRGFHTGTLLDNGQVLLVGGSSYAEPLVTAELYTDVVSSDTTPPTTQFTSPANGATVSGVVALSATATDNVGVIRVEFYRNNTLMETDTTAPYGMSWSTTSVANGTYVLTSRAYDAAGNVGTSAGISVTTNNDLTPPTTQLTSPASGATVGGYATLNATATDNQGVVRVEFFRGTTRLGTDTTAPYSFTWDTSTVVNGSYVLTSKAFDATGNVGTSAGVSVTVSNPTGGPVMASYDSILKAPRCWGVGSSCDTGTLVSGRGNLGPEPNQPNVLGGWCPDGTDGSYHVEGSVDGIKVSTLDGTPIAQSRTVKIEVKAWVSSSYWDRVDLYHASDAKSPRWVLITTLTPMASGEQTLSTTYKLPSGSLQAVRAAYRHSGSAASCTTGRYDDRDDVAFGVNYYF